MKNLLLLTLALSLPLTQVMGADNDKEKKKHKKAEVAVEQRTQESARPTTRAVRRPVKRQVQREVAPTQHAVTRAPRSVAPVQRQAVKSEASLNGGNPQRRTTSQVVTQGNRNNRNFDRNSFTVAQSRVIRVRHDRNWWRRNYNTTFVLFGGGYYYWWDSYWYPAYGYSPIYSTYAYSEPIYGYNHLAPGQVLENVQLALRNQGYYRGAIDGLIGPQTRGALAAFQRDHGLLVTSAVDEPTLVTLGLA